MNLFSMHECRMMGLKNFIKLDILHLKFSNLKREFKFVNQKNTEHNDEKFISRLLKRLEFKP